MPVMKPKVKVPRRKNVEPRASTAQDITREAMEGAVSSPPDPRMSTSYPRRIFLAVTGLSPQIVTETLYALAHPGAGRAPFVPTEIHVITTRQGAEHVRLNLLSEKPGWFHRLCNDFDLPEITFTTDHVHVLMNSHGNPMDDIRTPDDNEAAADFITDKVRELTSATDSALHVSIAGGRKTMGFYLGYALSLYGRPQDRLSHVLVSAPYESHPEFYYPTPYECIIQTRGDKPIPLDCRKASVELAEIPFVRLRHGMDERLAQGATSFSKSVASAQRVLGPADLVIDQRKRCIEACGQVTELPPAELALLAVFARQALNGGEALPAPQKGLPDAAWATRYLSELRAITGEMADLDQTERALRSGMDGEYFSSRLSKLRRMLKKAFGPAAQPYLIHDGGTRPHRYRLALPQQAVRFASLCIPVTQEKRP